MFDAIAKFGVAAALAVVCGCDGPIIIETRNDIGESPPDAGVSPCLEANAEWLDTSPPDEPSAHTAASALYTHGGEHFLITRDRRVFRAGREGMLEPRSQQFPGLPMKFSVFDVHRTNTGLWLSGFDADAKVGWLFEFDHQASTMTSSIGLGADALFDIDVSSDGHVIVGSGHPNHQSNAVIVRTGPNPVVTVYNSERYGSARFRDGSALYDAGWPLFLLPNVPCGSACVLTWEGTGTPSPLNWSTLDAVNVLARLPDGRIVAGGTKGEIVTIERGAKREVLRESRSTPTSIGAIEAITALDDGRLLFINHEFVGALSPAGCDPIYVSFPLSSIQRVLQMGDNTFLVAGAGGAARLVVR